MQAFRDPAIDAVDEGRKRNTVAGAKRLAERVQLARIDLRQSRQQRGRALLELQGITAEQRQRPRDAALGGLHRLAQRRIVRGEIAATCRATALSGSIARLSARCTEGASGWP